MQSYHTCLCATYRSYDCPSTLEQRPESGLGLCGRLELDHDGAGVVLLRVLVGVDVPLDVGAVDLLGQPLAPRVQAAAARAAVEAGREVVDGDGEGAAARHRHRAAGRVDGRPLRVVGRHHVDVGPAVVVELRHRRPLDVVVRAPAWSAARETTVIVILCVCALCVSVCVCAGGYYCQST